MNENRLSAHLQAMHHSRMDIATPPSLRERAWSVPERPARRSWLLWTVGWRLQPLFSMTKVAVVAVVVALLGGILLVAQSARPTALPGTAPSGAGTFSSTSPLAQPRAYHTATLLPDGRVLVIGGSDDDGTLSSAEVWDPATGSFSPAGSLVEPRAHHIATLLPDGRVLVVGGTDESETLVTPAEIWDPVTGTCSPAGTLGQELVWPIAALQPDGRVVVLGGDPYFMAEAWDPATSTFSPVDYQGGQQFGQPVSTALPDGRILIVGEGGLAEVWDPSTGTSSDAGMHGLDWPYSFPTLLPDGRVLVTGGGSDTEPSDAAVWDPATGRFSPAGSLAQARLARPGATHARGFATALPDGRVLFVGGCVDAFYYCDPGMLASAEIWDPDTNAFGPAGSLAEPRWGYTSTALPDGQVLVVGGWEDWGGGTINDSVNVWEPSDT
jgi:WD40 repeat protein